MVVAACSSGDGTSPPADGPESTDTQADQSAPPVEAETAETVEPEEGAQEPPPLEESIDEAPAGNPEPDPPGPPLPYDNAHALSVIEELAVRIGPRVKGTDGERAAGDFLSERFASFGYEVERQRFPITRFEILEAEVRVNGTSIGARVMGGSASGTAEGPLILVPGLGDASDYSALDVRGAVVLVERGVLFFQDKVDIAESEGAAAIIIYNNDGGPFDGLLGAGSTIPALSLDRESGLALREAEGTTAGITIEAGSARAESENIIASVSGGPCRLYVGGHYDSVTNVPGANDNASGTALVLELARAFAESAGVEEVCFVAFGAEEGGGGSGGLEGSRFLVRRLQESGAAAEVRAMLNLDAIGSGTSVRLVGSPSLADMARTLADALDIFVVPGGLPIGTGSDHVNFDAIGVPVIFPTVFGAEIHVPADNFANIDPALVERIGLLAHGILQCLIAQENGEALSGDTCLALVQAAA